MFPGEQRSSSESPDCRRYTFTATAGLLFDYTAGAVAQPSRHVKFTITATEALPWLQQGHGVQP